MSASRVEVAQQGSIPILLSNAKIAEDVFDEKLGAAVWVGGSLVPPKIISKVTLILIECMANNTLTVGQVSGIGIIGGSP